MVTEGWGLRLTRAIIGLMLLGLKQRISVVTGFPAWLFMLSVHLLFFRDLAPSLKSSHQYRKPPAGSGPAWRFLLKCPGCTTVVLSQNLGWGSGVRIIKSKLNSSVVK